MEDSYFKRGGGFGRVVFGSRNVAVQSYARSGRVAQDPGAGEGLSGRGGVPPEEADEAGVVELGIRNWELIENSQFAILNS